MRNIVITEELVDIELAKLENRRMGKRLIQDLIVEIGYYKYLASRGYVLSDDVLRLVDWLKSENKLHEFYFKILKHQK